MTRRRFHILAAVLLTVVLILAGAVLSLPAERIGALAAARAEAVLDRDVSIARARIKLLPLSAVALEELTLGGPRDGEVGAAADARPMAAAERVELRPRLLPLLWRQVVVNTLVVERPRVLIEVDEDGESNLPTIEQPEDAAEDGFAFTLRRLRINDGQIAYRDARDGTVVRLSGVNQQLRLRGDGADETGRTRLDGVLEIATLDAALPGRLAEPLREVRLRIAHHAELDHDADRFGLERLQMQVQDVALQGSGAIAHWSDNEVREIALQLETGRFDLGRLLQSLPASLRQLPGGGGNGQELAASGHARLSAQVEGRLGGGETPDVRGTLALEGASLAYGRVGTVVTDLRGEVAFSLQSVSTGGLTGRLLDQPVNLAFAVSDPAAPQARVSVRTNLDLARATRLGLLPAEWEGHGLVALEVTGHGPALELARAQLEGHIGLAGVRLAAVAQPQPLFVREWRLELRGQEVHGSGVHAAIGEGEMALDFLLRDWLPYLVGESQRVPELVFDARADRFDADAVFGYEPGPYGYADLFFAQLRDERVGGQTAAEVAEEMGLGLPELTALRLEGRVRAAALHYGDSEFQDLDLYLSTRDAQLEVRSARFGLPIPSAPPSSGRSSAG